MIVRSWSGIVRLEDRDEYLEYIRDTGGSEYERAPGCLSWMLMTRDLGPDERPLAETSSCEIVAQSVWKSEGELRSFTGHDIATMAMYPEDERYLLAPPSLLHFELGTRSRDHRSAGGRAGILAVPSPGPGGVG